VVADLVVDVGAVDRLYERAGAVASAAFTFGAERCDRVVAAVLQRLSAAGC
jgi:hypothetical protein